MMRVLCGLVVLLAACLLTACASVSGGNVQKMYVQTQAAGGADVAGAECVLSNDKGTWRLKTPGDTSIVRSNKNMEVKCDKAPLPQGVVSVESATRGAMYGNLIIGGVVGAVIDHSSGAAYEYPQMVKVVMGQSTAMNVPKGGLAQSPPPSAPVLAQAPAPAPAPSPAPVRVPSTGLTPVVLPAAAPAAAPAVTPGYLAAPVAASANPPVVKTHARAVPPTSGYAQPNNAEAVPVSGEGKARYLHYLTLPTPKAFVVYESGGWRFWFNSPDAMTTLLDTCAREGRKCWLYAVDNQVVWQEQVGQRVGRSGQLR